MKTTPWHSARSGRLAAGLCVALAASSPAAVIWKAGNNDNLNLLTSWGTVEAGTPNPASIGATDTLRFGGSGQAASRTLALGGDLSVGALRLDNQTGTPNYNVIISAGNTLTLAGNTDYATGLIQGIVLNSGVGGTLTVNADILLGASQRWVTSRNLTVGGNVNLGANTLTLHTAAGTTTLSGILSGTGGLTKDLGNAGIAAVLTGANTYSGTTRIDLGVLRVTGPGTLGGAAGSSADAGNIVFGLANANAALEFETAANLGVADQIRFRNTGGTAGTGGTLKYIGTTAQTVGKTLQCDTSIGIRLESASVGGSVKFNGAFSQTNRPLYLGGTGAGDNELAISFAGTGILTKRDAGRWILSGANTYSGATTISGGILQIGNGGTTGSLGTAAVANNASLVFNRSNNLSVGNAISGTGTLTQAGAGATTLGGSNTYAGTTYVNQGALILSGSTAAAGRIDVSASATLGGGGSGGIVTVANAGILAPGNPDLLDNQLDLASLSLAAGGILKYELGAPLANPLDTTPDFYSDHVALSGALILDGTLQITPVANAFTDFGSPVTGNRWLLLAHAPGGLTNNTLDVNTPANLSLLAAGLSYQVDTDVDGFVYLAVVPEAQSGVLLAAGLLLLRMRRLFSRG